MLLKYSNDRFEHIELNQEVLDALINILNNCYIDIDPHRRKTYPDIVKIINKDLKIINSTSENVTYIPLYKLNLILCISLYLLYNKDYVGNN